jgi:hypothetical protein
MSSTKEIASLRMRLKGFLKPSTKSQVEGFLEPGKYRVIKKLQNQQPDDDTDYALVQAPALGAGDTWICTRWKDQCYADIEKIDEPEVKHRLFETDNFAISETTLINLIESFVDFTYDLDAAYYPFNLKGVRVPRTPPGPRSNNCCTFVEALLAKAWEAELKSNFRWSSHCHGQMMILSNDDFFSPVTAVIENKMAVAVPDPDTPPHPWTLIQGWRRQWRGGHTFLIVDHHAETDRVLTLESNSSYKLNGVGFRGIGNLRDTETQPPENWWEIEGLWTWDRICWTYRYRQQANLKVKDRTWGRT